MSRIHLFTSLTAGLLGVCLSMACLAGGKPEPVQPGDLLGSTGNVGNSLIDINPTTGAGSLRGSLGSFGPVTELRFRTDGVLFATTGGGQSNLITINPDTAQETLVGEHDPESINGLAFVGDTLYGALHEFDERPELGPEGLGEFVISLVTIDQTDASLTIVGQIEGYSRVRGLAWDENTGTLYGVGSPSRLRPEGDILLGDILFTIDPDTASISEVGSTGFELGAITFGSDGTLYAGTTGGFGPLSTESERGNGSALLVTLDPDTGESSIIGDTGSSAISGLDFVPTGVDTPAALAVPTLNFWTLLLLALTLLVVASWRFRQRRNID